MCEEAYMRRFRLLLLMTVLGSLMVVCQASKIPDAAWQQGTLTSLSTDARPVAHGYISGQYGVYSAGERTVTHYLIDTPEFRYEATRSMKRHDHQLKVTVNGPIRFALAGNKVYILDDDGKRHELEFVQKIKK